MEDRRRAIRPPPARSCTTRMRARAHTHLLVVALEPLRMRAVHYRKSANAIAQCLRLIAAEITTPKPRVSGRELALLRFLVDCLKQEFGIQMIP